MKLSITEQINKNTIGIDMCNTSEIIKLINQEDKFVAEAVERELSKIAKAVDLITETLKNGGKLYYFGAGTSGRLGVLDASECPPTFGVSDDMVIGIIAGGDKALRNAVEGAEDDAVMGSKDASTLGICENDAVVGITASGGASYVIGALEYAHSKNAATICLCNVESPFIARFADVAINIIVGPEVICGSTRLKAGTAQKMVLNMISTASMIKLGKVYGNLMVDVKATNKKLKIRAINIVCWATGVTDDLSKKTLESCEWNVKTAIVSIITGCNPADARLKLQISDGFVRNAIQTINEDNKK